MARTRPTLTETPFLINMHFSHTYFEKIDGYAKGGLNGVMSVTPSKGTISIIDGVGNMMDRVLVADDPDASLRIDMTHPMDELYLMVYAPTAEGKITINYLMKNPTTNVVWAYTVNAVGSYGMGWGLYPDDIVGAIVTGGALSEVETNEHGH